MTEQFYVGIKSPVETRRALLESSKSVLQGLQAYEDVKELRKEKVKITYLFNTQVKEIQAELRKVKKALPSIEMKKTGKKKSTPIKPKTDAKELEKELADIEKELKQLK